jgi:ribosomal protein S18 acetylase RimI-like enzyme
MASRPQPRLAGPADAVGVADILAQAFHRDPVWGWAFPDPELRLAQHKIFWRFCVDGGIAQDSVWISADGGAVSVWVPPGCTEFLAEDEARLEPVLTEMLGREQTAVVLETFDRFEAAHPRDQPHHYLSLLATDPEQRGRGLGVGLVADNLARIDAEGIPAYLESTNPANNARYERLGFEWIGEFALPEDGPRVARMWREARPAVT